MAQIRAFLVEGNTIVFYIILTMNTDTRKIKNSLQIRPQIKEKKVKTKQKQTSDKLLDLVHP